jgi:small subunit ribosomal protein S1
MAQLLAAELDHMPSLRRGDAVEGTIVYVDQDGVLVNIGAKSEGMIPTREMRSLPSEEARSLKSGDTIMAVIVRQEETGQYLLSYDRAQAERGWRTLEQELDKGGVVKARVVGYNRGGLLVETMGVQGFVPLSQLSQEHRGLVQGEGDDQNAALSVLMGQDLPLKVIEVNRRRQRAILSERMANQEMREEQRQSLLSELKEGTVRHGRVTGVRDFGAFVDLGGADGLIHISELSWEPVTSPADVVQPGQEVDVYILKVDPESKRISLSLRRTQPDPWQLEASKFTEGQVVEGTVTRLAAFGAFARLEGNIEGLIHISELADRHIRHPREVVKEGDVLSLKILRIEPERRRLGLSLRQTAS